MGTGEAGLLGDLTLVSLGTAAPISTQVHGARNRPGLPLPVLVRAPLRTLSPVSTHMCVLWSSTVCFYISVFLSFLCVRNGFLKY